MNDTPKFKDRFVLIFSWILAIVYAAVSALSLFMNGDDYLWYSINNYEALSSFRSPNGRFFSNYVTLVISSHPLIRTIFVFVVLLLLILLISKVIGFGKERLTVILPFSLSLFILIPSTTYCETVCWISGFTNYIFTPVLILLYLKICFSVLFSGESFKPYCFVLFLLIGFVAGLCVEHVAIYDVLLGIAFIVLLKIRRKKFFVAPFLYLVSSLIALYYMFTNKAYSSIYNGVDDFGNRSFQFDFSDFFMNTLRFVIPNYIKSFWVINIVIALSIVILYHFKCREHKSKYAPVCLVIVILYAVYSVFCSAYSDLALLTPAMRGRGFETAFSFLYVVSLAYFIWIFFGADKRIRLYIFLLSTILLTGPFMFINPCTARCFIADYIFWILLGGDLFFSAFALLRTTETRAVDIISLSVVTCLTAFILNVEVTNCYTAHLRYNYIRDQINSGKKRNILVIDYPYPEYTHDDMSNTSTFDEISSGGEIFSYFTFMGDYYGFDGTGYSLGDFSCISLTDYHLLEDAE